LETYDAGVNNSSQSYLINRDELSPRIPESSQDYLYADNSVLCSDHGVSEGYHFLSSRRSEPREKVIPREKAHLTSNISNDLGQRMVFNLSVLVPRRKVSEFSLDDEKSQPPSFREPAGLT
jgi:hypothetical protein